MIQTGNYLLKKCDRIDCHVVHVGRDTSVRQHYSMGSERPVTPTDRREIAEQLVKVM